MDVIVLLLFFCLQFLNFTIFKEISSQVPISKQEQPPAGGPKPLALNLRINSKEISVFTGVPEVLKKTFSKDAAGNFPLEDLHKFLIEIKKEHPLENTAIMEPETDITYEEIVKIMDEVRMLRKTDEAIFANNQRLEELFGEIIFGNI
jgi:hypothetical protein